MAAWQLLKHQPFTIRILTVISEQLKGKKRLTAEHFPTACPKLHTAESKTNNSYGYLYKKL